MEGAAGPAASAKEREMIEEYRFGQMKVAGQVHRKDLLLFGPGILGKSETVEGDWWRREGHRLHPEDLDRVEEARPGVLVIGPGAYGRMAVPEETLNYVG